MHFIPIKKQQSTYSKFSVRVAQEYFLPQGVGKSVGKKISREANVKKTESSKKGRK